MNKEENKVKQTLIIDYTTLQLLQHQCELQTLIDKKRADTILKGWNDIINNYDDLQTIYIELQRYVTNIFLNNHILIDGNKRMHRIMAGHTILNITNRYLL